MAGVVSAMDAAMRSMNLEKVSDENGDDERSNEFSSDFL